MRDPIERYLTKRADLESRPLVCGSVENIRQVVVIPLLAERESIGTTLDHLARNDPELLLETLVVCVVNNREAASVEESAREDNRETLAYLRDLAETRESSKLEHLRVAIIDAATEGHELRAKEGVGTARKLGLDWGLEVLRRDHAKDGILLSLDADTWVEPNYLKAVRSHFDGQAGWGAVVDFAHRLDGPEDERAAILNYELFLRYHEVGLAHARSPYAFQTVGSTMVCTCRAYAAVGGMRQRLAGEDFYFLQELAKTGHVGRIGSTTVHPSSRPSWRTPFGTGSRVERFLRGQDEEYRVYHPDSYEILRTWLQAVESGANDPADILLTEARGIAEALAAFLVMRGFESIWPKLQSNVSDTGSFLRQFHRWFDGFMTLKLIHYLRENGYPETNTFQAVGVLLKRVGVQDIDIQDRYEDLDRQRELLVILRGLPETLGRA